MEAATLSGGGCNPTASRLQPYDLEAAAPWNGCRCGGALELVDVSDRLPELPRLNGLHDWKVMAEHIHPSPNTLTLTPNPNPNP